MPRPDESRSAATHCVRAADQTYLHLLAQGKPKMVAIIACMRKLIILLNTMFKQQKDWQQITSQT